MIRAEKLKLGDFALRTPYIKVWPYPNRKIKGLRGKVVYIHPEGRFHCVEFEDGIRECYPGVNRDSPPI